MAETNKISVDERLWPIWAGIGLIPGSNMSNIIKYKPT